ncbi:hypothetical protein BDV23DRAFT_174940 [Aspergillus alliaceus]|uniref:Nucleoside phosphorylase domain-containing protein n=1 Tax=Petromyces alliaceus TaxID=209559 RepID=A0A5N7BZS6_PETAA|nr:hypothetical protein BDV23DRAFT_174940 [Aspergillus alliaceus]
MLDEDHESSHYAGNNRNIYTHTLGRIGGTNSAAAVALQMKATFTSILFVGGGVPREKADIRFGDVVSTSGRFERIGFLNSPPAVLLNASAKLENVPIFTCEYAGPDFLFDADYGHIGGATCGSCNKVRIVKQRPLDSEEIAVHYSTIASGNRAMKDAAERDKVSSQLSSVLCFEMEAAECLPIRGII